MARLSDIPIVLRRVGPLKFIYRIYVQVSEDNLLTMGAAVAYSWLFAIFPFMIFMLTLVPYLPAEYKSQAATRIHEFLFEHMGDQAAAVLWNNVEQVLERPRQSLLGIGIFLTIWAASGGVNMTMTSVERCYELCDCRPFWIQRPLSIMLTAILAVLILLVVILLPVGTVFTDWLATQSAKLYLPASLFRAISIARWSLAVFFMVSLVSLIYYFGPPIKQKFTPLSPGVIFTIVMWVVLGLGFRIYIRKFALQTYNQTYGTVGGVAILLLIFYFDAVALLIGAEINSEIDFEVLGVPRGSRDFRVARLNSAGDSGQAVSGEKADIQDQEADTKRDSP